MEQHRTTDYIMKEGQNKIRFLIDASPDKKESKLFYDILASTTCPSGDKKQQKSTR